jgi:uncharacterized protein YlzI (FlbEa/FlbD family)
MIRVINTEGMEILLNAEAIQAVESGKETVVTLVNGEKLHVKNHPQDIVDKIRAHKIGLQGDQSPDNPEDRQEE